MDNFEHPEFCPRLVCGEDPSEDFVHREAPQAMITPASAPDQMITFALVRSDEIGPDGKQIIHPVEGLVTHGGEPSLYNAGELISVGIEYLVLGVRLLRCYMQSSRSSPRHS